MRVLLDTQLAFWWLAEPTRVPEPVRALVLAAGTEAWMSHVSLWELALKQRDGRAHLELARFAAQAELDGFQWLPVTPDHLTGIAEIGDVPKSLDAFDQLLLAQCLVEPLVLLTTDRTLASYGVPVRLM